MVIGFVAAFALLRWFQVTPENPALAAIRTPLSQPAQNGAHDRFGCFSFRHGVAAEKKEIGAVGIETGAGSHG